MARPIREDYSGAWRHVMNRGRNRAMIFLDDDDALDFLNTTGDTVERSGVEVHAYSLMARFAAWVLQTSTYMTHREIGEVLGMTLHHVAREARRNKAGISRFKEWTTEWLKRYPRKMSFV